MSAYLDVYLREALFWSWDYICVYCRKKKPDLHVDHIRPRSAGGPDSLMNYVPACRRCNQVKGSKRLDPGTEEFFLRQASKRVVTIISWANYLLYEATNVQSDHYGSVVDTEAGPRLRRTWLPLVSPDVSSDS